MDKDYTTILAFFCPFVVTFMRDEDNKVRVQWGSGRSGEGEVGCFSTSDVKGGLHELASRFPVPECAPGRPCCHCPECARNHDETIGSIKKEAQGWAEKAAAEKAGRLCAEEEHAKWIDRAQAADEIVNQQRAHIEELEAERDALRADDPPRNIGRRRKWDRRRLGPRAFRPGEHRSLPLVYLAPDELRLWWQEGEAYLGFSDDEECYRQPVMAAELRHIRNVINMALAQSWPEVLEAGKR
jgi:hypothetical protein